ncbi:YdeA protein [Salmonella enterica]|nr:YdeA protein [Salmonella enterica]
MLAALDAKHPGPVATKDIERVLEQGGDAPVYGPNLRASCRCMEAAGWLRTLRAPNLQLLQNRSIRKNARLKQHDNV